MQNYRDTTIEPRLLPPLILVCHLLVSGLLACGPRPASRAEGKIQAVTPEAQAPLDSGLGRSAGDIEPRLAARDLGALKGQIVIDGSSTVFPITEEVAYRFRKVAPGVEVRLGVSGTGGGFKKFCHGETMISDASRPIKAGEKELCRDLGVDFIELPVAFDGLSVVVHPDNPIRCMTVDELRRLWEPAAAGVVDSWRQIRSEWPAEPVVLYAPGRDSGTFDYFTSAIVGSEASSRDDFIGSEDDYLLAQNIASDRRGLGFFGYAYYREYQDRLRLVEIDGGDGCVAPSGEAIRSGTYRSLSRPIFIYVALAAAGRPEVVAFVDFFLADAAEFVTKAKYVALPARAYQLAIHRFAERKTGSLFDGGSQIGLSIASLLELEASGSTL